MTVTSPDLYVNKKLGDGVYMGSLGSYCHHNVRWNSNSRRLEYEQNGYWYLVPEDNYEVQLPPELNHLVRWCRDQYDYPYGTAVVRLLEWLKNTKDRMEQTQKSISTEATLQDAWQEVAAALDRFIMLQELTKNEGKL